MHNKVELISIERNAGKVLYKYTVEGEWRKVFRAEREYFVEYSMDVSNVPKSILVIPFLANILPIAWVYDAEIKIGEVDKEFIECIDEIKRAYVDMFPKVEFKGKILVKKIEKNERISGENKSLLFFSGGVDATSSLINTYKEKPMLCTLWGSDIFFQDVEGWNSVKKQVEEVAENFCLPYSFVKTSFRTILNYDVLNEEIARPNRENWWHGFQHGIGIIAHAAPIAYLRGINRVYIASSVSIKSAEDFVCASSPAIDNNVRFCGTTVLHEGIENSRGDKIRKICKFSQRENKKIKLRVCWITRTGENCCVCEKCARTLLNILAEGYSPNDFGFDMSQNKYEEIKEAIEQKKINIPLMFWGDIIHLFSLNPKLQEENSLVKYLVTTYPQFNKEYKKKMNETRIELEVENTNPIIFRSYMDFSNLQTSFASVGMNTGNQVFLEALKKELDLNVMTAKEYLESQDDFSENKVVTTDLIWINENSNFDYLYNQLQNMKYQTMVPISVGLQAQMYSKDFKLNDSVMRVLSAIQERAIIGVRGDFTASILEKHGIKNYEVIGCPSMYYWNNPSYQLEKKAIKPERVAINFRTFYGQLNKDEKHFLTYAANRNYDFIEQTKFNLEWENCQDSNNYSYLSTWLNRRKQLFFTVSDWMEFMQEIDFSMGARFHGNVIALWNNIPSLFVAIDSRTEELIRFFNLPCIKMNDFDESKPIEYYYELADYTEFNKGYEKKYNLFIDFLKKNGLL